MSRKNTPETFHLPFWLFIININYEHRCSDLCWTWKWCFCQNNRSNFISSALREGQRGGTEGGRGEHQQRINFRTRLRRQGEIQKIPMFWNKRVWDIYMALFYFAHVIILNKQAVKYYLNCTFHKNPMQPGFEELDRNIFNFKNNISQIKYSKIILKIFSTSIPTLTLIISMMIFLIIS